MIWYFRSQKCNFMPRWYVQSLVKLLTWCWWAGNFWKEGNKEEREAGSQGKGGEKEVGGRAAKRKKRLGKLKGQILP